MDLDSVTLDEVFAAAHARSASLVPETSGYLALAIADASARLPFRIDDTMVSLTTEGSVQVARGQALVSPDESARRTRDTLARLLARSVGSMPALTQAARPKSAEADMDAFIRELETALVPVNRAAARRALARLARETARAKASGRLRRRRPQKRAEVEPEVHAVVSASPDHLTAQQSEPPPQQAAIAQPTVLAAAEMPAAELATEVAVHEPAPHVAIALPEEDVVTDPTPTEIGEALFAEHEPQEAATMLEDVRVAAKVATAPPIEPPPLSASEALTASPRRSSRATSDEPARLGQGPRSDVDALLEGFVVSTLSSPETMRQTRASLKRLAGLDPTPPPPAVAEVRRLTEALEAVAKANHRSEATFAAPAPAPSRAPSWLLIAALLLVAGLLGHFIPQFFAPSGHALTSGAKE